jgi:hypothetical protein
MWATTLALMTTLNWAPAQSGPLELKNARVTYGILGQERKDTSFLPGDLYVLAFDIDGLQVKQDGVVQYSMGMELTTTQQGKSKSLFKKDPQEQQTVNTLGGTRLPSFALTEIGTDTEPGEYTMTVTVTDRAANKTVTLARKFEVKKLEFGIVRPGFVYNDMNERQVGRAQIAPPLAVPGQNLVLNFATVGFELKGDKQQPNVTVTMKILDESGNPVLAKPFKGVATDIDEDFKKLRVIPWNFPLQMNRSGKFKIVLQATDEHNKKTAEQTLDLKVIEVN